METTFIQQVVKELLGDSLTGVILVTAYIFSFAGIFLRWVGMYHTKGKPNPNTPKHFVFSYWIRDNLAPAVIGILATIVTIFITLRFPQEYFGTAFSYGYAFVVGMCLDFIASKFKLLRMK